jgi:hypothetical protein
LSRLEFHPDLRHGMAIAGECGEAFSANAPMNDDAGTLGRVALALALLASWKIGRGGGLQRVRQRLSRTAKPADRRARGADARGSPSRPDLAMSTNPRPSGARRRAWLTDAGTAFWVTLLLFAVAYAIVRGEWAFADLDQIGLLVDF